MCRLWLFGTILWTPTSSKNFYRCKRTLLACCAKLPNFWENSVSTLWTWISPKESEISTTTTSSKRLCWLQEIWVQCQEWIRILRIQSCRGRARKSPKCSYLSGLLSVGSVSMRLINFRSCGPKYIMLRPPNFITVKIERDYLLDWRMAPLMSLRCLQGINMLNINKERPLKFIRKRLQEFIINL